MRLIWAAGALALVACSQGVDLAGPSPTPSVVAVDGGGHVNRGTVPGTEGLTKAQLLDRSLSHDGMRGVVSGEVVSAGAPRTLPPGDPQSTIDRAVVDYRFRVIAVYGAREAPYVAGSTVTLRLPAPGSAASEGFPAVADGSRLLVWASEQPDGGLAGPSSATVLPVPDRANVAVVTGDMVDWLGYRESLASFVAHFTRNPVR